MPLLFHKNPDAAFHHFERVIIAHSIIEKIYFFLRIGPELFPL